MSPTPQTAGRLERVRSAWRSATDALGCIPVPVAVALLMFAVFCYRPMVQGSTDNQPLRFGSLLLARDFSLDFSRLRMDAGGIYSFRVNEDGSIESHTPIATAYLGAAVFLAARVAGLEFTEESVVFLDFLAASLYMAVAAGMIAHLARREGRATAWFCAVAFALGTAVWSTASRCLWQHTGGLFALLTALCLFDGARVWGWRMAAGTLVLAFAVACRPFLLPACAIILLFQTITNRRTAFATLGVVAAITVTFVGYNLLRTGTILTPYMQTSALSALSYLGMRSETAALMGSLFSPNRGMFVFSPVLLLAIPPMVYFLLMARSNRKLAMLALCAWLMILLRALPVNWHGGHCYGSRYMLDAAPFMVLVAAPFARHLLEGAWWKRAIPIALLLLSGAIHYLGVSREWASWNIAMNMTKPDNAWNMGQSQIMHCLTYGESTRGPLREATYYTIPVDGVIAVKDNAENRHLRYGFAYQEPWGWWAMPPKSGLVISLPGQFRLRVAVELMTEAFPLDPTHVDFYWNGRHFGRHTAYVSDTQFRRAARFSVPKDYTTAGYNWFEMRLSRVYYGGASSEPSGAAINRITILPE